MSNNLYTSSYDMELKALALKSKGIQERLKVAGLGLQVISKASDINQEKLEVNISQALETSRTPEEAQVAVDNIKADYVKLGLQNKTFGAQGVWRATDRALAKKKFDQGESVRRTYEDNLLTNIKNLPSLTNSEDGYSKGIDKLVQAYSNTFGEPSLPLQAQIEATTNQGIQRIKQNRMELPQYSALSNMDARWNNIATDIATSRRQISASEIKQYIEYEDRVSSDLIPEYESYKRKHLANVLGMTNVETLEAFKGDLGEEYYSSALGHILGAEKRNQSLINSQIKDYEKSLFENQLVNGIPILEYKFDNEDYEGFNNFLKSSASRFGKPAYMLSSQEIQSLQMTTSEDLEYRDILMKNYLDQANKDFPKFVSSRVPEIQIPDLILPKTTPEGETKYLEESENGLKALADAFFQVRGLYGQDVQIKSPFSKNQGQLLTEAILAMKPTTALSYISVLKETFNRDGDANEILNQSFGSELGGIGNWATMYQQGKNAVQAWEGYKKFLVASTESQNLFNREYDDIMESRIAPSWWRFNSPLFVSEDMSSFLKMYTIGTSISTGVGVAGMEKSLLNNFTFKDWSGGKIILPTSYVGVHTFRALKSVRVSSFMQPDLDTLIPMRTDPNTGMSLPFIDGDSYLKIDLSSNNLVSQIKKIRKK